MNIYVYWIYIYVVNIIYFWISDITRFKTDIWHRLYFREWRDHRSISFFLVLIHYYKLNQIVNKIIMKYSKQSYYKCQACTILDIRFLHTLFAY